MFRAIFFWPEVVLIIVNIYVIFGASPLLTKFPVVQFLQVEEEINLILATLFEKIKYDSAYGLSILENLEGMYLRAPLGSIFYT